MSTKTHSDSPALAQSSSDITLGEPVSISDALKMKPDQIFALAEGQLLRLGSLIDLFTRSEVCGYDRGELAKLSAFVESALAGKRPGAEDALTEMHLSRDILSKV